MSIVLFCGRPTFGFILNLLPGNSGPLPVAIHHGGPARRRHARRGRTHLGRGNGRQARTVVAPRRSRLVPIAAALAAAAVVITLPGWLNRAAYASTDSTSIGIQVYSDQTDGAALDVLLNDITARGGGRTYAGLPGNWGQQYAIGQVPVYAYLADNDVDEFGFTMRTPSLVADNEAYFNQSDPAQYQLYNIRYILMPSRDDAAGSRDVARNERQASALCRPDERVRRGRRYRWDYRSQPRRHGGADAAIPRARRPSIRASWGRSRSTAARPRRQRSRSPPHPIRRPEPVPTCSFKPRTATSLLT